MLHAMFTPVSDHAIDAGNRKAHLELKSEV